MLSFTLRRGCAGLLALGIGAAVYATEAARFYYGDLNFDGYASASVAAGAINNHSQFVGTRALSDVDPGLAWSGEIAEPLQMLPVMAYQGASATALNEAAQVAGVVTPWSGAKQVYRFTPGVGIELLGSLDGASGNVADINEAGTVVGTWAILGGPYQGTRAFVSTSGGPVQQLPTLGGHDAYAADINDNGYIVGRSRIVGPINFIRACYWFNGQCLPLGPDGVWSQAIRINNAGTVLGVYLDADLVTHGFIQAVGGAWQPVPMPAGATVAAGYDINELGQIVGLSDVGTYLYTPGQGATLIDVNFTPTHLNNAGHVAGVLLEPPYVNRGWFWSPETGAVRLDDVIVPSLPWSITGVVDLNDHDEMLANGVLDDHSVAAVVFPTRKGDMNCDGVVDFADVDAFVAALGGQAAYLAAYPNCNWPSADTNRDGAVDFGDIDAFVALLSQ